MHCIGCDSTDPLYDYNTVRNELTAYDKELLKRPQILLCTKSDLLDEMTTAEKKSFMKKVHKISPEVIFVSILEDDSIETLKQMLIKKLTH